MAEAAAARHPVRVVVRLRPVLAVGRASSTDKSASCVAVQQEDSNVRICNPKNRAEHLVYSFDRVLPPVAPTAELFQLELVPLLEYVCTGGNATCFAYGITGAGKTFTMDGTSEHPGLVQLAAASLLSRRRQRVSVHVQYLELYKEKVYDLLADPSAADIPAQGLAVRSDAAGRIFVHNLSRHAVASMAQFTDLMDRARSARRVAETALNATSSRSHAMMVLSVCMDGRVGKLNLIDLAGSEDNRRAGNVGERLAESGAINKSLFTLHHVVDAINAGASRIPYRDSKLTRLLQDSLGGSARAVMIANLSPDPHSLYSTYQTLNFASHTRRVVNVDAPPPHAPAPAPEATQSASSRAAQLAAWQQKRRGGSGGGGSTRMSVDSVSSASSCGSDRTDMLMEETDGAAARPTRRRSRRRAVSMVSATSSALPEGEAPVRTPAPAHRQRTVTSTSRLAAGMKRKRVDGVEDVAPSRAVVASSTTTAASHSSAKRAKTMMARGPTRPQQQQQQLQQQQQPQLQQHGAVLDQAVSVLRSEMASPLRRMQQDAMQRIAALEQRVLQAVENTTSAAAQGSGSTGSTAAISPVDLAKLRAAAARARDKQSLPRAKSLLRKVLAHAPDDTAAAAALDAVERELFDQAFVHGGSTGEPPAPWREATSEFLRVLSTGMPDQLAKLPEIGKTMQARIMADRASNGAGFAVASDLCRVGMSGKTAARAVSLMTSAAWLGSHH